MLPLEKENALYYFCDWAFVWISSSAQVSVWRVGQVEATFVVG